MAYELYYTAHIQNEETQTVEIFIYKKDAAAPDEVENYEVRECELTDNGEGLSKYECIITRELLLTLWVDSTKSLTWETFIASQHDEWKVVMTIDGQYYFHGFITPDEGNAPFQDKPYEVTFRATNCLTLLKGQSLSKVDGSAFDTDHPMIEYIAGALKKTGLDLPIRIYCQLLHASMQNKGNLITDDMFQQTDLNYGDFQSDAITFISCYDALLLVFDKFCTIEYWNGMIVISEIAQKQFSAITEGRYYVDYDSDGVVTGGGIDTDNYGRIGKQMDLYPINETQNIFSKFAVKSVTTRFIYNVRPEIPRNNKFEHGTEFETGDAEDVDDIDGDGNITEIIGTYKKFTIDDWDLGKIDLFDAPAFPLTAADGIAYRRSVYNDFGIEIDRAVVVETPATGVHWLRSKPVPVTRGSKIKLSLQKKFTNDFTGGGPSFTIAARVYLIPDGSTTEYYAMHNDVSGAATNIGRWKFEGTTPPSQLIITYVEDQNSTKYASLNVESLAIPVNGKVYIALECAATALPALEQWYKDFEFEYIPFTAGGYLRVKGDYVKTSQTAVFPDVIDEEVSISDSLHRVVKGALLFNDQLTDGAWFQHGPVGDPIYNDELKPFKYWLNKGRFNHAYRRMYALSGDFNGLNWSPENDAGNKKPLCFYIKYREVDMDSVRDFVLVPPLKMDILKGRINANLVEVFNSSADGTQTGTTDAKFIF